MYGFRDHYCFSVCCTDLKQWVIRNLQTDLLKIRGGSSPVEAQSLNSGCGLALLPTIPCWQCCSYIFLLRKWIDFVWCVQAKNKVPFQSNTKGLIYFGQFKRTHSPAGWLQYAVAIIIISFTLLSKWWCIDQIIFVIKIVIWLPTS